MTSNVAISLDKRRQKKDGTYPIVLRLSYNQRTATIPTGYAVPEKDWNANRRMVKKSYKGVTSVVRLNNHLIKQKAELLDKLRELEEDGKLQQLSAHAIKKALTRPEHTHSFLTYMESLIKEFRQAQRFGNAQSYWTVLGVLRNFCEEQGKSDLTFKQVTYKFLKLDLQQKSGQFS